MSLVKRAIELMDPATQVALAKKFRECGYPTVRQSHVHKWVAAGKFPPEWSFAVEAVTDGQIKATEVLKAGQRKRAA